MTTYTPDLAALLVVVLAEQAGDDTAYCLYGQGTRLLAQQNPNPGPLPKGEGEWTHLLLDGLGSVRIETDGAGEVIAQRAFKPYGAPLAGDGGTTPPGGAQFGFTGEMWDDDTELVFLRARYMQPGLGMFLARDLVASQHPYVYVANNPINYVDPSGLIPNLQDVNEGKYTYFCNCGWIDWPHANPARRVEAIYKHLQSWQINLLSPVISGQVGHPMGNVLPLFLIVRVTMKSM